MKKLAIIISLFVIVSCNSKQKGFRDAQTQFIVTQINEMYGMEKMTTYYVEIIDANNLSRDVNGKNLSFWFSDSIGKYKLGQPIHFDKNR
jgi:hypothetical protein